MAIGYKNQNRIISSISSQEKFSIASMAGNNSGSAIFGQLSSELRAQFMADKPVYVVYSYATPIAWVTESGEWVIPADKYSKTTTAHQNLVRQAVA